MTLGLLPPGTDRQAVLPALTGTVRQYDMQSLYTPTHAVCLHLCRCRAPQSCFGPLNAALCCLLFLKRGHVGTRVPSRTAKRVLET